MTEEANCNNSSLCNSMVVTTQASYTLHTNMIPLPLPPATNHTVACSSCRRGTAKSMPRNTSLNSSSSLKHHHHYLFFFKTSLVDSATTER
eukprot:scaffold7806_cov250-Ochromonas_danica.AAC.9